MKLTKARINKLFLKIKDNQTRKRFKNKRVLTHSSTYRNEECNIEAFSLNCFAEIYYFYILFQYYFNIISAKQSKETANI
jgi:hypothetical protein